MTGAEWAKPGTGSSQMSMSGEISRIMVSAWLAGAVLEEVQEGGEVGGEWDWRC